MNVVNFEAFKESKEIKRCEDAYGNYLKTLANAQLETEVNSLLEEFSDGIYGKEFFSKGQLILKEITSRTANPVRRKIELLTQDTFNNLTPIK